MSRIQRILGTEDVLPDGWSHRRRLCDTARRLFGLYGYGEISTPTFEDTRLFVKGTGETTDIVQKEMYTIPSRTDASTSLTLRPEGTPPTIRAYLDANMHKTAPFRKLFYIGAMFRRERPQKGRLRQFHQIGVEVVGSASPLVDAETIVLADRIFREAGLTQHRVCINSIGDPADRAAYRDELRRLLADRLGALCDDCRDRFERNVLRLLDCKNHDCQKIVAELPTLGEWISDDCRAHHEAVREALGCAGVAFEEDAQLVRGLDYYGRTVFEIKHAGLGARSSICGGGRYDGLVELLGGPSTPCVGFGIGVEPALIAMESELGAPEDSTPRPDVYIVCFERAARGMAWQLLLELREAGIAAGMDMQDRSSKAQMRQANRQGARLTFLLGRDELEGEHVAVKDMEEKRQWSVLRSDAVAEVKKIVDA
jgi:histidyl-tRNA synthetase